jgi:DUF4097 and DUF4098 domain-containing protein YvlB
MKSRRIICKRWLASALAAALVAAALCALTPVAHASAEGGFQRTLTVTGPVDLDLTTGSGNIRISSGSSGQVQITARIKVNNWFSGNEEDRIRQIEANPPIQQTGNTIHIGHLDNELGHNISISYEVMVPPDTRLHAHTGSGDQEITGLSGPIETESGSGNVRISKIGNGVQAETGSGDMDITQVKGDLRAKTGSGGIHATDVAGGLEAHSGSGDIEFTQTAPGSVRVNTGSGEMKLRGVKGTVSAEAGSGDIDVEGEPTGSWNLHTGSGEVQLKLVADAGFDLDAHTSSGSITVNAPVTVQGTMGRKELRGKVRGGGVPMVIRTGSGDIEIE